MEEAITAEPYVPNLKTLREKIDQDTHLLGSLDPSSEAHRRLQARITDRTTELLDYEEILERRRQHQAAADAVAAMPRPPSPASEAAGVGLLFTLPGLLVSYLGWGTWWLVLAGVLLLCGVPNLIEGIKLGLKNT